MKLKHLPNLTSPELALSMEDNSGVIDKYKNAFKELKDSFSKKLEAKTAAKAVEDVKSMKAALVDLQHQLGRAQWTDGKAINISSALTKMAITASNPTELIRKLRARIAQLKLIEKQLIDIKKLKQNSLMDNDTKKKTAEAKLKELKTGYQAMMEKPAASANMVFTKAQFSELVKLSINYCDLFVEIQKHGSANLAEEGVTDRLQDVLEWFVDLVTDIAAFFYSILRGVLRFVVGIFLIIALLSNPVAGIVVFLGAVIIVDMIEAIKERAGDDE